LNAITEESVCTARGFDQLHLGFGFLRGSNSFQNLAGAVALADTNQPTGALREKDHADPDDHGGNGGQREHPSPMLSLG
jgi:hypothetical protein